MNSVSGIEGLLNLKNLKDLQLIFGFIFIINLCFVFIKIKFSN